MREKMVIWEGVGESGCGSGGGSEREDGDVGRCRREYGKEWVREWGREWGRRWRCGKV